MQAAQILFGIAILCYFLSTCGYWWNVRQHRKGVIVLATLGVGAGLIVQGIALLLYSLAIHRAPFGNLSEVIMVLAWVIALVHLVGESRYRTGSLGNFLIPLAFLGTSIALVFPEQKSHLDAGMQSIWLGVHIFFAFAGIAVFALIFGAGIMYMIQEHQLKSKKIGAFYYRLPSLETLDGMNATAQSFGFPFLTLGLIAGAIWSGAAKGSLLQWDLQRTMPLLVTWLVYAVLFTGRLVIGWSGYKPSVLAVAGFCIAMLTYFIHTAN